MTTPEPRLIDAGVPSTLDITVPAASVSSCIEDDTNAARPFRKTRWSNNIDVLAR